MGETTSSAATRALISRSALQDAATAAVAAGGRTADLRGDAYGHGLLRVARVAAAAGVELMRVESEEAVAALGKDGIAASTTARPDMDTALLYGLPGATSRAVLRLTGRVHSTKRLRAGEAVSYGYTYRAPADRRIALVTGGYAQGIVRALGNHADIEIDGALRPIVGRVAMDVCVVDLGDAEAAVGTEATFFGGTGPAARQVATWAKATGLRIDELVTVAARLSERMEED